MFVCEAEKSNHIANKVSGRIHVVPKRMNVSQTSFIYGIWKIHICKLKVVCYKNCLVNHSEGEK